MKTLETVLDEYINHLNTEIKTPTKTLVIDNSLEMIERYKKLFYVDMQEANLLKKYYFVGLSLAKVLDDKKQDVYLLMLDYLNDVLYEKIPLESKEFYDRTLKKIAISILEDRVEEDFGEYGIYYVFSSLIRYYEDVCMEDDTLSLQVKKVNKKYSKLLNMETIVLQLKDSLCKDNKDDKKIFDFECNNYELKQLESFISTEVQSQKPLFCIYRYMLKDRYKSDDLILSVKDKQNNKTYTVVARYFGEKDIEDIKETKAVERFQESGIKIIDTIEIYKVELK